MRTHLCSTVIRIALCIGSGLAGVACVADLGGEAAIAVADEGGKDEAAVIIGAVDWVDVNALAAGTAARENARAVAYLDIPAHGSRCTGFLIAHDVIMTNQHCIRSPESARGVQAFFRYEAGVAGDTPVDCSVFLGNDEVLDFALLQCAGRPGDTYGTVSLAERAAGSAERIYVIHQNCDYFTDSSCTPTKKYSAGLVRQLGREIGHDADTLGGSSGSPLFAEGGHGVIGLHHAGSGNGGDGRGTMNWAVPMSNILPALRQRFPGLRLGAQTPTTPVDDPAPAGDGYEPNNTRGDATLVATTPFRTTGAAIAAGTPADVDVYALAGSAARRTIEIAFTHAAGDLDIYVVDAAGKTIARSAGTSNSERIEAVFASDVLVIVNGYRGAAGAYTLTLN